MRERLHQLDYLKGIFILLMVTFHLAPIYENYPVTKEDPETSPKTARRAAATASSWAAQRPANP